MDYQFLKRKVTTLLTSVWDFDDADWPLVEEWLSNFGGEKENKDVEELYALFLLSQFMYFNRNLIREMLRSLYLQVIKAPIIHKIRRDNCDTFDSEIIEDQFHDELAKTRFLGVGNPSESGPHLLYYFRQENNLPKDLFMSSSEILQITRDSAKNVKLSIRDANIKRYIFVDDILGSGRQIKEYLTTIIQEIKEENSDVDLMYCCLFATSKGISKVKETKLFKDGIYCIYELDDTFKCFSEDSRYFVNDYGIFNKATAEQLFKHYGNKLWEEHPLGYKNGQLLLSLFHNTPDNTLPVFWVENKLNPPLWNPIFKRYHKIY